MSTLYALLDGSDTVDVAHLRAALAPWRYCDESARIVFGEDEGGLLERKVRTIVAEQPGIGRNACHKAVSHKLKADVFDAAVDRLVGRKELVVQRVHEGKRPAERSYPGTEDVGTLFVPTPVPINVPTSPQDGTGTTSPANNVPTSPVPDAAETQTVHEDPIPVSVHIDDREFYAELAM